MSDPTGPNALARLDKAVALLKEARTLDEVGRIRATAAAAAEYARAEKLGDEAIHYANEIRVRAARRAGELLAQMTEKAKGAAEPGTRRGTSTEPRRPDAPPRLADLGITKKESVRFQAIASIPEEKFEAIVRGEKVPTETAVAKKAQPPRPVYVPPNLQDDPHCTRPAFLRICNELTSLDDPRAAAERFARPVTKLHTTTEYLEAARTAAEWLTAFLRAWPTKGALDVEAVRKTG